MEEELDFENWKAAIGKIILSCSRVEYELNNLYIKWMPGRSYHSDDYASRYDKAIGVANASLPDGNLIAEKLIEMKGFARYRHLVAHNPIHYSNETGSWHIFDLKDDKSEVNLNDLIGLSHKAFKASTELAVLLRINV